MSEEENNSETEASKVEVSRIEEPDYRDAFEKNYETPIHSNYLKYKMHFEGSAFEYYKIWFVNLILSIVSFGIYSAWAKVRKQKYLYANTYLDGENFDYVADPVKILKGRLLIAGGYALFLGLGYYNQIFSSIAALLLVTLLPWLFVRAMIFKTRNTTHRNIHFGFKLNYSGSYATYLKVFFVYIFTLGIGSLWGINKIIGFTARNSKFGRTHFQYFGSSKPLYKAFFAAIFGVFTIAIISGLGVNLTPSLGLEKPIILALGVFTKLFLFLFFTSVMQSEIYRNTLSYLRLDKVTFRSKALTLDFLLLNFGNVAILIFSLGLAYPIVTLRNHRFKMEHIRIRVRRDVGLNGFADENRIAYGATADAAGDFWDMDIGI